MATTKRSMKGPAAARRVGAAKSKKRTSAKPTPARANAKPRTPAKRATATPRPGAKASAATKPKTGARVPTGKRPVAKPAAESAEVTALKAKLQRERSTLDRRLTEAMREIGLLRHHELRAVQLERQIAERDATIARLQTQLAELERRPPEPVYVHEIQQTLALGGSALEPADVDEFDDDPLEIVAEED